MATRDLTRQFISIRSSTASPSSSETISTSLSKRGSNRSDSNPTLLSDVEIGNSSLQWNSESRNTLPPIWVDTVDQVDDNVRSIQSFMKDLEVLHGDRINAVFEDSTDRDYEIESLTKAITGKFRDAEKCLKKIGKVANLTESEQKVRSNIQRSMAKKLQELSLDFRKSQKQYLMDVRGQKSGNDVNMSQFGIDLNAGGGSTGGATGGNGADFTTQQMAVVDDLEGVVNERDEEIQKIAASIEELSTIFKELAVLVIDQGTILDRIDFNMEQVVEHTKEGIKQLEKAEAHQKSARPAKCIACLLVLIAVMLLILIMKHT
ncbi:hypothetical protein ScalyP_jg5326 [Parmales sp. scaly parma]|nr:hypothetical protein ScalyP_jg5326 [Parmales sp. scaly parma]